VRTFFGQGREDSDVRTVQFVFANFIFSKISVSERTRGGEGKFFTFPYNCMLSHQYYHETALAGNQIEKIRGN